MLGALVLILIVAAVSCISISMLGVAIFKRARRSPSEPAVPVARMANPAGAERAYAGAVHAGAKLGTAARHAFAALGLALVVAPWLALAALVYALRATNN
jgi:hypothetical protein